MAPSINRPPPRASGPPEHPAVDGLAVADGEVLETPETGQRGTCAHRSRRRERLRSPGSASAGLARTHDGERLVGPARAPLNQVLTAAVLGQLVVTLRQHHLIAGIGAGLARPDGGRGGCRCPAPREDGGGDAAFERSRQGRAGAGLRRDRAEWVGVSAWPWFLNHETRHCHVMNVAAAVNEESILDVCTL